MRSTKKNPEVSGLFVESLGVFGKLKGLSQTDIERFVLDSHRQLLSDEKIVKLICESTNLHRESVKAYKIGFTNT